MFSVYRLFNISFTSTFNYRGLTDDSLFFFLTIQDAFLPDDSRSIIAPREIFLYQRSDPGYLSPPREIIRGKGESLTRLFTK